MLSANLHTPVALFIFNRPDTTQRVFDAIRQVRPSKLMVIADGPREGRLGEATLCEETRNVLARIDWDCEVLTNFSEVNLGCKRRVSSGLEWVFDEVNEAIILEDDCLPQTSFFWFCEAMLSRYRDDERVMMVSGTNYLHDRLAIEESYTFSRYFAIWGWASWRRAWRRYDIEMRHWPALREQQSLSYLYPQPYMQDMVRRMFDETHAGRIDTWDIQWFYTCLFQSGLTIVPRVNQISNIGLVGTHTTGDTSSHNFPTFPLDVGCLVHPEIVSPDSRYDYPFFEERFRNRLFDRIWRRLVHQ